MYMALIRHPLGIVSYAFPGYEQLPPLQPLLEAVIGWPLQWCIVPNFFTLRLVMISYEAAAAAGFYWLVSDLIMSPPKRVLCLAGFLALPTGWMTSVVMAQDDPIGATFVLVALLLAIRGRLIGALLLCGTGVLAGKLFLGLEVIALLAFCRKSTFILGSLAAFGPILGGYGLLTIHRLANGFPLPLVGFRPDPYFGTNFWMLLAKYYHVDLGRMGPLSGVIALVASVVPVLIVRHRPLASNTRVAMVNTTLGTLILFFSFFYHVNPEYFMLVGPLMLLCAIDRVDVAACILVATLPWAGKLFQNATYLRGLDVSGGKLLAYRFCKSLFGNSPAMWLAATQAAFSLLTILVGARCCFRLLQFSAVPEKS